MIDVSDLIGLSYQRMNCWDCARTVLGRCGTVVPDVFGSYTQIQAKLDQGTNTEAWLNALFGQWKPLPAPVPGCALAFQDVDGAAVHIGVMVDADRFVHSTRHAGVVLTRLDREPWATRLMGAYGFTA